MLTGYKISGLDIETGLKTLGDTPSVYLNFLKKFYEQGQEYRNQLQEILLNFDHSKLHDKVHGLRGVAATLGAYHLDKSCKTLLNQLSAKPELAHKDILVLTSKVLHTLDKLLSAIQHSSILEQDWKPPQPNPVDSLLNDVKLIFIEDETLLVDIFAGELRQHFGEVVCFSLAQQALDYIDQQTTSDKTIIITDVRLSDYSGLVLAEKIVGTYPDIYILLISGEDIPAHDILLVNRCITLLKPIGISEIINLCKGIALNFPDSKEDLK